MESEAGQSDARVDKSDLSITKTVLKLSYSQAYDDIFIADNGSAHPDRVEAEACIIIAPHSDD